MPSLSLYQSDAMEVEVGATVSDQRPTLSRSLPPSTLATVVCKLATSRKRTATGTTISFALRVATGLYTFNTAAKAGKSRPMSHLHSSLAVVATYHRRSRTIGPHHTIHLSFGRRLEFITATRGRPCLKAILK